MAGINDDGAYGPRGGGRDPSDDPSRFSGHRDEKADPNKWDPNGSPMPPGGDPAMTGPSDPSVKGLGGGSGKGANHVNTLVIKQFAQNLQTLAEPLRTSQTELAAVSVRPGTFPTAMKMRNSINPPGDSSLATTLAASFGNLYNGLLELSDALLKIASKYDSAEELNKLDLQDYKERVAAASGYLQKLNTGGGSKA